ncbi:unnamed protein product [Rotaria magnacalcarata]|uniref:Enoyl-CoA hydratase domain-containing protein 3, mitochondrial n=1 Tax=Rotaria magnacalcarata TaxID=392030 RepID=A0A816NMT9_9BILA|nr:unnamed protein product [Rotaria magnacalcarata]CAF4065223.1 unnamed protein product [Rotaria magnacalcarata]
MLLRRIICLNSQFKNLLPRHASSATSLVTISTCDEKQICRIKLNNPRQRNILSLAMINDLIKAIEDNEQSSRVIVLTAGDQTVFSSGHSLKELSELSKTEACGSIFDRCTELMLKVRHLSIPVIAEVFGLAAAAGCQLVASCDIVVAGENASFSVPGVKHGLFCITPAVAVRRSITNSKLSSLMLFTGEPISAKEAYEHGLVSRVVGQNDLERETNKIAQQICANSRPVVALGKKYLQLKEAKEDLLDDYQVATRGMLENLDLKDTQHGLESFIKKTRPTWTHKNDKI